MKLFINKLIFTAVTAEYNGWRDVKCMNLYYNQVCNIQIKLDSLTWDCQFPSFERDPALSRSSTCHCLPPSTALGNMHGPTNKYKNYDLCLLRDLALSMVPFSTRERSQPKYHQVHYYYLYLFFSTWHKFAKRTKSTEISKMSGLTFLFLGWPPLLGFMRLKLVDIKWATLRCLSTDTVHDCGRRKYESSFYTDLCNHTFNL